MRRGIFVPMTNLYRADTVRDAADLEQILALQRKNLSLAISPDEAVSQGFVTVEHDLDTITEALYAFLARTPSMLLGVCLDDVLGALERPNVPGTTDELRSMVAEAEYRDFLRQLAARGVTFRAMLFSAGGNDVVGAHMASLLRDHDPGLDAAGHIEPNAWAQKMGELVPVDQAIELMKSLRDERRLSSALK